MRCTARHVVPLSRYGTCAAVTRTSARQPDEYRDQRELDDRQLAKGPVVAGAVRRCAPAQLVRRNTRRDCHRLQVSKSRVRFRPMIGSAMGAGTLWNIRARTNSPPLRRFPSRDSGSHWESTLRASKRGRFRADVLRDTLRLAPVELQSDSRRCPRQNSSDWSWCTGPR
jgi:hypothetical protein